MSQPPGPAEVALHGTRYPSATRTIPPTDWLTLELVPPWVPTPSTGGWPHYRIDSAGNVELRGQAEDGPAEGPIAILPEGFRPPFVSRFAVSGLGIGATRETVYLAIGTDGTIDLDGYSVEAPAQVVFNGVRFSVFF